MKQIKCPFDGTPCQSDCIDRFPHRLEGGCRLTDHLAAGMPVLVINKPTAELIGFYPDGTHEVFDLSDLPAIICSVDSPDELSGCRSNRTALEQRVNNGRTRDTLGAWGNLCALFEWGQYYES